MTDLPLAGYQVLDFTRLLAGPGTAMYLADLGADVIKIEPPDGRVGEGATFALLNRGKRSIALDLRTAEGQAVAHELVKTADVAVVALEPGGPERLGIDYERLAAINPRLVYARITGWGHKGPNTMKIGIDLMFQAYSGMMWSQPAQDGSPTGNSFYPADMSIPLYLPYAITAALLQREKTGLGQKIETSQLQAQMAARVIHLVFNEAGTTDNNPGIDGDPTWAWRRPPHTYCTSDGKWLVFIGVTMPQWRSFWNLMELGEFPEGVALGTIWWPEPMLEQYYARLAANFRTRTRDEWFAALAEAGLANVVGPVLSNTELFEEAQVWENGFAITQQHPTMGTLRMPATPFSLSTAPIAPTPSAEYGQHTDEVLLAAGYTQAQINAMRAKGTVA